MSVTFRNKLFFLIVLFSIFTQIPNIIQLNFLGSFLAKSLSFYPILFGVVYFFYDRYKRKDDFHLSKSDNTFLKYISIYFFVLVISFIHGLMIYPYYDDIISGPINQIDKLLSVQRILVSLNIDISEKLLLRIWMFCRLIKGFILETFWYFAVPYIIYDWYKHNVSEGFSILIKGVIGGVILICVYNIFDIMYLSGLNIGASILTTLNPIIHVIESNGTWWPPILWNEKQLRSLFAEPSYYGIYASFAMPLIWYSFMVTTNKLKKVWLLVLIFLFTFGLFLTNARTGNALFFIELILLVLFSVWRYKKCNLKKVATIFFLSIIAFFISIGVLNIMPGGIDKSSAVTQKNINGMVASYFQDNIGSLSNVDKRSNRARFSMLESNIAIGLDYPILGVGKSLRDAYVPAYLSERSRADGEVQYWIKNQTEKGILKSGFPELGEYSSRFATTGIVGITVFFIPIIYLIRSLFSRIRLAKYQCEQERCIFFFISFSGIVISGIGDVLSITCCYWILLGLGYAIITSPYERK